MLRIILALSVAAAGADVRAVLDQQAAAWNRGDLKAFVETYEDSAEITFLGKELWRGRANVLARYERTYSTKEKMGSLRFEIVESKALGATHHLILGKFFLTRSAAGGGNATGNFTLVLKQTAKSWKIIHDHTS
ncbi:MAG: SgcJ/EcaC family oxidoreductase [Acidobacteria bacterium]|nr:SgcJ/EcaC family oxidoreductase [Acidobacteriota bacterium]